MEDCILLQGRGRSICDTSVILSEKKNELWRVIEMELKFRFPDSFNSGCLQTNLIEV